MTNKEIIIDGVNVAECRFRKAPITKRYNDDCEILVIQGKAICQCSDNPNCYYKQLAIEKQKNKELEKKLKQKLTLKNAPCEFFEGQTGLCRAKEFKKCNPVNCKEYTMDSFLTIQELKQKNEQLETLLEFIKERISEQEKLGFDELIQLIENKVNEALNEN